MNRRDFLRAVAVAPAAIAAAVPAAPVFAPGGEVRRSGLFFLPTDTPVVPARGFRVTGVIHDPGAFIDRLVPE